MLVKKGRSSSDQFCSPLNTIHLWHFLNLTWSFSFLTLFLRASLVRLDFESSSKELWDCRIYCVSRRQTGVGKPIRTPSTTRLSQLATQTTFPTATFELLYCWIGRWHSCVPSNFFTLSPTINRTSPASWVALVNKQKTRHHHEDITVSAALFDTSPVSLSTHISMAMAKVSARHRFLGCAGGKWSE